MERDPSFVFNGAYTPAVCRIVSAVVAAANSPNPDVANADLKNLVPGHKVGNLTVSILITKRGALRAY